MNRRILLATALLPIAAAWSHGGATQHGALTLEAPWTRAAGQGGQGAGFLTIRNAGGADRLLSASTPAAGRTELHTMLRDGDIITGGGVTAGIDFAFRVIEQLRGLEEAERLRLGLEYDPQPIGMGGTPSTVSAGVLHAVRLRYDALGMGARREAIARHAQSLGLADR
mgnify:CR=1 FL=1